MLWLALSINVSKMNTTTERIQLLQRAEDFPVHVYHCNINIVHRKIYIGLHSDDGYFIQDVESYLEDISPETCLQMHTNKIFQYSSLGMNHKIKANYTTYAEKFLATMNGKCIGATYTNGWNSWEDVIVQDVVELTIQDYETVVKLVDGKITFPCGIICNYKDSSCIDDLGLTIWQVEKTNDCNIKHYEVLYGGEAEKAMVHYL